MFLYFIAFVVGALVTIYSFFKWKYNYWKSRGVPHQSPEIFFGNIGDALKGKIHFQLIYYNLYKKFTNVPYFGFYKLWHPVVVIKDLDIIKDVMVKEFNKFSDNDFHVDENIDPVLAENPFVVTGDEWKEKRTQWSSAMTQNRIKLMFDVMTEKVNNTVKKLEEITENKPKEPLDAKDIAVNYLTDTIVGSVLGLQIDSFVNPDNEFKALATNLFAPDFWTNLHNLFYLIAPWMNKLLRAGAVSKKVLNQLLNVARQVTEYRRKNGFVKNDFFEALMKKENVSDLKIAGRIFGFLTEGVETSSGLITFTLYELAVNPQVQAKLRKEIMDSVEENDGKLTYEAIHSLSYFDQIINETLRLHPPVFAISRVCTQPYELPPLTPGGKPFMIPVGMPVIVPSYATSIDPEYFKDPETFDPDRFSPENKDQIRKYAFMPFGEGPRICVGQRLGLTNSKNCIANIIRNFEVRLHSKTMTPLQISSQSLVNRAVGDIWITLHKISP